MKVDYKYPVWPELTQPKGPLPKGEVGAQACWFFYTLAQKQYEQVGESIDDQFGIVEGDLWLDKRYHQLAKTVATMYGLESPDQFTKFWKPVIECARLLKLPTPQGEYMRPYRNPVIT